MCRNLCEVHACAYGTRASMRVQRRNAHAALSSATPIGTRNGTSTDVAHAGITATQTTHLDPNVCERACAASALCSQVCSTLGLPRQCVGFFQYIFRAQLACHIVHDRLSLCKRTRTPALARSHSHKTSFAGMSDGMQRCAVADTSQSHQALCWSASGAGKCCQKGRTSLHLVCTKSESCERELRAITGSDYSAKATVRSHHVSQLFMVMFTVPCMSECKVLCIAVRKEITALYSASLGWLHACVW